MAINPIIPQRYYADPCNSDPAIVYVSKGPVILFLTLYDYPPLRQKRLKEIRGRLRFCGWKVDCRGGTLISDGNTQPDTFHVFYLPTRPPGTVVWYVIHTEDSACRALASTPALRFTYPQCPPTGSRIRAGRTTQQGAAFNPTLLMNVIFSGNPALQLDLNTLITSGPALWELRATGTIREFVGGSQTCVMSLTGNTVGTIFQQTISVPNNGQTSYSFGGQVILPGAEHIELRCDSSLGSGAWNYVPDPLPLVVALEAVA